MDRLLRLRGFQRRLAKETEEWISKRYKEFNLKRYALSYKTFKIAMYAYINGVLKGKITRTDVYAIIDYSKPSNTKRLFVLDMKNKKIICAEYVAHGKGRSGKNLVMVEEVSNKRYSNLSSVGLFITAESYTGKHGYSLRLDGVEQGFNDNARARSIVMHGASYVSDEWISRYGRIGRSFGCFAVDEKKSKGIIDILKGGVGFFVYYPDKEYLGRSQYASMPLKSPSELFTEY